MIAPKKKPTSPRPCPCWSGRAYDACCAPYHRGQREAEDATRLMRSRYAAFALGDGAYLWRTLHEDHEDRAASREAFVRAIAAGRGRRYTSLAILDARDRGREAEVLFAAGIEERGHDLSFLELSDFAHDGVGWRYRSGILVPRAEIAGPVEGIGIDAFLALAGG